MLHCMNLTGDMTVYMLERQRERMKSEEEEQGYFSGTAFNINGVFSSSSSCSSPLHHVHESMMVAADSGSALAEVVAQARSMNMNMNMNMPTAPGFDVTFSCPPATDSSTRKDTFKKRKPDKPRNSKFVAENDRKDKRIKVGADDGESKNSTNTNSNANNGETCADTSNSQQKSKASEAQKPDFIHVRARRGQATDSHSLAERVRREKISERMKYLQDLVPGCNKITGKAGMLDEIINYVQSLQRQVEFLSMKLATVNPRLDFSVDDVFEKEVFSACRANFPNIGMASDMTNPAYLQFNSPQQIVSYGGLDNASDMGLRRTIGASVSMPETHLHSSCFNQQMLPPSSTWEGDFQNLCNLDFDQARGTSFPSQLFSGLVEAGNLKMEM